MSRRLCPVLVLAVALALASSPVLLAATPQVSGTVVSVSPGAHRLELQTDHGRETVYFSKTTKFEDAGKTIAAKDLKKGQNVQVSYLMEDEQKQALEVDAK